MKKIIWSIALALVVGFAYGQENEESNSRQHAPAEKFIEQIAGSWRLQRIVDEEKGSKPSANQGNKKDKNSQQQGSGSTQAKTEGTNAMQTLEFNINGRYKMNSAVNSLDSGSYRLNEQHGILYMESDNDDITPSEWAITMQNEQLTLVGRGEDAESRYKYVYQKSEEKLNTN